MSESTGTLGLDRELKAKHRAMWGLGNYPAVATQVIAELGPVLVRECGVQKGDRVLDVAAGSGNAAIPAAALGAQVIATDLAPELFVAGREAAALAGVELDWQEADAEALPFGDNEFDVVLSCVGVMFAPHHRRAADELLRVCRPGGKIGVLSWTPTGFIGEMFKTMKPYAPPPPPGSQPAPLWGDENHVRDLLGDVAARKDVLVWTHSAGRKISAISSRRITARPSRCTGTSPAILTARRRSIAICSSWQRSTAAEASRS